MGPDEPNARHSPLTNDRSGVYQGSGFDAPKYRKSKRERIGDRQRMSRMKCCKVGAGKLDCNGQS